MTELFCNIASLPISMSFKFEDLQIQERLMNAVSGKVSGIRLPDYSISSESDYEVACQIILKATIFGDEFSVEFGGDISIPMFVSDFKGFHWDFWKVALSLVSKQLLLRGIVTLHAACVQKGELIYLMPGSSGAGKSAMSFFSRSQGGFVYATELCFIDDGKLIAGNATMSIDSEAINILDIPLCGDEEESDGKLICSTKHIAENSYVNRIIFPKISALQKYRQRDISARRTRMLLYENAIGQLGMSQLIDHQKTPVLLIPSEFELKTIASEIEKLSASPSIIAEGSPDEIWRQM